VSIISELALAYSFPEILDPPQMRKRENVGAPTFKVLLEGYIVITKISNGLPQVVEGKQLAFAIRMAFFPK